MERMEGLTENRREHPEHPVILSGLLGTGGFRNARCPGREEPGARGAADDERSVPVEERWWRRAGLRGASLHFAEGLGSLLFSGAANALSIPPGEYGRKVETQRN